MLRSIQEQLDTSVDHNRELTWAVASLAFFGFFRLRELLPENEAAYIETTHLSWGDVVADDLQQPTMLRVHLKRLKCEQIGSGVDVFVGSTGNDVHQVAATVLLLGPWRGTRPPGRRVPTPASHEGHVRRQNQGRLGGSWLSSTPICWPQLSNRCCHNGSPEWAGGFRDPGSGPLAQRSLSVIHKDTGRQAGKHYCLPCVGIQVRTGNSRTQ